MAEKSANKGPFKADHVGSLLRPPELLAAREKFEKGDMEYEDLRPIEDKAIEWVVKLQEDAGLESATDGEFRRKYFHIDFLKQIDGVEVQDGKFSAKFKSADGEIEMTPQTMVVAGKLKHTRPIQGEAFDFLKDTVTSATAKVSIPSPSMLHFRGGRAGIDEEAYPDMDQFYADLARAYQDEISDQAGRGCKYVQMDDTNLAYLCDPELREATRKKGEDPDELPRTYARLINESFATAPDDMAKCVHMCRGNFKSAWVAEGGYEPVAEIILSELDIDGFFMEYDDERSGDFAPLRYLPKGDKTVVLGLITSKSGQLEKKDDVIRRIEEASKYAPIEQLALSPQCGFSSSSDGNQLSVDEERRKLDLIVDIAETVWG